MMAVAAIKARHKILRAQRATTSRFISFADSAYREAILQLKPERFCFFFNLRAKLGRKDVWIEYDPAGDFFVAHSDRYRRQFRARYQNYNTYRNGLADRGIALGREYLCDSVEFKDGDVVVDCGANVGDLQLYFEELGLKIDYIALEPSPSEFSCLQANIAPSRAFNVGLWSEDRELNFFVSSRNADSSFVNPGDYTDQTTVPARRLDSLIDCDIKLLKIEAEGAEPEVLVGCEKILDRVDYISADLGFERGMAQESTLPAVTNFLLKHNFEMINLNRTRVVALYRRVTL